MTTEVLIAGGNGFLGKALTRKCIARGWAVDVVVNKSNEGIESGVNEIIPYEEIGTLKEKRYKYIFNAAAFIPYGAYNKPDERLIDSNIALAIELHRMFASSKIIFASSVAVYGNDHGLISESSECVAPTMYGLSKLAGEMITSHHQSFAVLRFSSLYGRGMYKGTFIPAVIDAAKNKKVITLLGSGERKQNYLDIRDAAEYCIHAALHGNNEVYLGVYPGQYQNREVADIIARSVTDCDIVYTGSDSSPSFMYNNKYTAEALKFTPQITMVQGLKDLINE